MAGIGIYTVLNHKLSHAAFGNHFISFAPVQQGLIEIVAVILKLGTVAGSQGTFFVFRPATGEIFADIPIALAFHTVHHDFRAVIELWNAASGQQ